MAGAPCRRTVGWQIVRRLCTETGKWEVGEVVSTRRIAVASGLLAGPAALSGAGHVALAAPRGAPPVAPIEPVAGAWRTWVLASGSELRPPPPPGDVVARAELAELRAFAAQRDAARPGGGGLLGCRGAGLPLE